MKVEAQLTGTARVTAAFDAVATGIQNPRGPLLGLAHDVVQPLIAQRFADQGPGWHALSPAYAAWKRLHYGNQPILVRTGAMRTALTGGVGSAINVSGNTLTILLSPPAIYHQLGTRRMPARPVVSFTSEQQTEMGRYLAGEFTSLIRGTGLAVRP